MSTRAAIRWKNLSIGVKLGLSFFAILLIFVITAAYHYTQMKMIQSNMESMQDRTTKQQLAQQLKQYTLEISLLKNDLMVFHDPTAVDRYFRLKEQITPLVAQIGETASTRDQRLWRNQLQISASEYLNFFEQAAELLSDPNIEEEERQSKLSTLHRMSEIHKQYILTVVDNFNRVFSSEAEEAENLMLADLQATKVAAFLAPVISIVVSILLSALFIMRIRKPIYQLRMAVQAMAEGDLRQHIEATSQDEIGILSRYFNMMIDRMNRMLGSTQRVAAVLKEHAESFLSFSHVTVEANGTIVRALREISHGADKQASLTETCSTLAIDMRSEMSTIKTHTRSMNEQSTHTIKLCASGADTVSILRRSADETELMLDRLGHSMAQLIDQSTHIASITKSITDFAHQTNILAINASIVASQAGVEGKGFSVIAAEIKELSDKSRTAASQIHQIISSLDTQMEQLSTNVRTVQRSVHSQHKHISASHEIVQTIHQSMNLVNEQIHDIHLRITASEKKQEAIVTAMETITKIAEQAAASAQEIRANAELQDTSIRMIGVKASDIHRHSQLMSAEINRFKLAAERVEPLDEQQPYEDTDTDRMTSQHDPRTVVEG